MSYISLKHIQQSSQWSTGHMIILNADNCHHKTFPGFLGPSGLKGHLTDLSTDVWIQVRHIIKCKKVCQFSWFKSEDTPGSPQTSHTPVSFIIPELWQIFKCKKVCQFTWFKLGGIPASPSILEQISDTPFSSIILEQIISFACLFILSWYMYWYLYVGFAENLILIVHVHVQ